MRRGVESENLTLAVPQALFPRYKTGGYGAMVEDEDGKWCEAAAAIAGITYWYERAMRAERRPRTPPEGGSR